LWADVIAEQMRPIHSEEEVVASGKVDPEEVCAAFLVKKVAMSRLQVRAPEHRSKGVVLRQW